MKPLFFALLLSACLHVIALFLPNPAQEGGIRVGGALKGGEKGRASASLMSPGGRITEMKSVESVRPAEHFIRRSQADEPRKEAQETEYGSYYPSQLLTRRPVPLSEVHLDGEFIVSAWPSRPAILALWIEADGRVSRIEVETSDYPESLIEALRVAFGKLRFRPGEVDGRDVPTFLLIEASYSPASEGQP